MNETEKLAMKEAAEALEQLQSFVDEAVKPRLVLGAVVLRIDAETMIVGSTAGAFVAKVPPGQEFKGNEVVLFDEKSGAVQKKMANGGLLPAHVVTIAGITPNSNLLQIDDAGGLRIVVNRIKGPVEVGNRVALDPSGGYALAIAPQVDRERFAQTEETHVVWDDIGGAAEAKAAMREAIEYPIQFAKLYKHYGKKGSKGVLLAGPPGCGKTMLGKAAATSVAQRGAAGGFLYVKGPEVLNKWVGESEATIRGLFASARKHKAKTGSPAVIFIDEADALLSKRGDRPGVMDGTIVPMFLAEMDGLEESAAIVILATNRPGALDPAVVREGRIDRKVMVRRPTFEDALVIAELHAKRFRLDKMTAIEASEIVATEAFSSLRVFYRIALHDGGSHDFQFSSILSGAAIAAIFDQAAALAIQRDIDDGTITGIRPLELRAAVDRIASQNRGLNHDDDLAAHVEPVRAKIKSVTMEA